MDINSALPTIALVAVAVLIWSTILWLVTKILERPVLAYFNWLWKPRPEEYPAEVIKPKRGAKLQLVAVPLKQGTVHWKVFATIGVSLLLGVTTGIFSAYLYKEYLFWKNDFANSQETLNLTATIAWVLACVAFATLLIPATYWYYEWRRRNQKLVVFTHWVSIVEAVPVLQSLIFPFNRPKDPRRSDTPTTSISEVIIAADPEDLAKEAAKRGIRIETEKTPLLRDFFFTKRLSRKCDLGSMLILSPQLGALDPLTWVPNVRGTRAILENVRQAGIQLELTYRDADKQANKVLMDFDNPNWDQASGERAAEKVWERYDKLFPATGEAVFLFDAEDPGLWDKRTGNPTDKAEQRIPVVVPPVSSAAPEPPSPKPIEVNPQRIERSGVTREEGLWGLFKPKTEEVSLRTEEEFLALWETTYRGHRRIYLAGFSRNNAMNLYMRHSLEPKGLDQMIKEGKTKEEILAMFPLGEDSEGG